MEHAPRKPHAQEQIRELLLLRARRQLDRTAGHTSLTHLTGAAARGWWTPPLHPSMPTCITQTWRAPPTERRGTRTYRHRAIPAYEVIDGLRVAPPTEILLTCARELGLLDMVVLVDGASRAGVDCARLFSDAVRFRGAPALRQAIQLSDVRAESAWETVLRMFHHTVGVPVDPQVEILDGDGSFLARADLLIRNTRTLHEYDGGHHLDVEQQRQDLRRLRDLANAGWIRRGYTSRDLTVDYRDVARDCDLALERPPDPRRLRAWEELLSRSMFSRAGQYRLRRILSSPRTYRARTEESGTQTRHLGAADASVLATGTTDQGLSRSA